MTSGTKESEARVLEREELFRGHWSLVKERVELPNGVVTHHLTIEHPGAIVVIPQSSPDSFLLVRQYRHSVRRTILEFPAGTLGVGESPLACAQREICEEAGHAANDWIELGTLLPTPGFCSEVQHLFLARDLVPKKIDGDEDEIIEVVKLTTKQIETAISTADMIDAKSIAIFTRARLRGLL